MSFYYSKSFVLSAQEFPGAPGVITEGHPLSGWGGTSLEFSEFGFGWPPAACFSVLAAAAAGFAADQSNPGSRKLPS